MPAIDAMNAAIDNMIEKVSEATMNEFCRKHDAAGTYKSFEKRFEKGRKNAEAFFPTSYREEFQSVSICGYFENLNLFVFLIRFASEKTWNMRSGRRLQFDYAKFILRKTGFVPFELSHAIFVFADECGRFRFSLVENPDAGEESLKHFRRYTFTIDRNAENRTFRNRMRSPWNRFEDVREAFSVNRLNKEFYEKLSDWFFWARERVRFPGCGENKDKNAVPVIRMITRLLFVWFLKQKKMIPDDLFQKDKVAAMLHNMEAEDSSYYKAILQNLFFATLNTERNDSETHVFRKENKAAEYREQDPLFAVYRYEKKFSEAGKHEFLQLMKHIPFLNRGLFSCLDDENKLVDCFSDNPGHEKQLFVPNELFWMEKKDGKVLDISKKYGNRRKRKERFQGLIPLLSQYDFTIVESTPNDAEIALDPELLGRVFENLLACRYPETAMTARKQTGSFYTPREIVDYMVEQSLIRHILTAAERENVILEEEDVRALVSPDALPLPQGILDNKYMIVKAIETCTILDPACGSGAFPMGLLSAFVRVLDKLTPAKSNTDLYNRKRKLIQNCIYCVDIQPLAVQILKLRCFISLLADKDIREHEPNHGIEPLPNLEMHFIAANSLIDFEDAEAGSKSSPETEHIKDNPRETAGMLFSAEKRVGQISLQQKHTDLRRQFADFKRSNINVPESRKIARWDPFNPMASAPFFNPEWMFGRKDGFDIVIGNPPYISIT